MPGVATIFPARAAPCRRSAAFAGRRRRLGGRQVLVERLRLGRRARAGPTGPGSSPPGSAAPAERSARRPGRRLRAASCTFVAVHPQMARRRSALAARPRVLKNRACHSHLSARIVACGPPAIGPSTCHLVLVLEPHQRLRRRGCRGRSAFPSSADGPRSSCGLAAAVALALAAAWDRAACRRRSPFGLPPPARAACRAAAAALALARTRPR